MPAYKKVTIAGASGSIGSIILRGLLATGDFSITVLSRKDSAASFPDGVAVRKTDFSESELETIFKGQEVVISALGATGFGEQKKLIDAALRSGVHRFIPSEFSASSQNEAIVQLLPLFGAKKEVIEYLKASESAGLTWTGIATGLLFDWGLLNGFLGFDIPNRSATVWDAGEESFTLTNESQLANAVIAVLRHPDGTRNKFLHVASVRATQSQILAALEAQTGEKWTVHKTTTEQELSESRKKLTVGDFSGALGLVRATSFGKIPGLHADYVKSGLIANDLLGLKQESVEGTVSRLLTEQETLK
ncbi:hypothetical protein N7539_007351 [Penicillium diatomitis]|uniref:NmrA-like domain-containing protein n=1 Tax=Penicillium diatomitis TaxID=2819901 RepID=A0A9W9WV31_9EURO|nr:uncharacterized protein N7539_007351 [Penicillium diatomitis]KAJ5477207.1 hypothetical protein N7539_007351 [Penicillium diatomitis]